MKPSVEQISNLLSHRNELRQDESYWQDFLQQFHANQRTALASKPAPLMLFEQLRTWLSEVSPSKWAYGAGLAYTAAFAVFFFTPRGVEIEGTPLAPVNHEVLPTPSLEQLDQLDLKRPTEGVTGEQAF